MPETTNAPPQETEPELLSQLNASQEDATVEASSTAGTEIGEAPECGRLLSRSPDSEQQASLAAPSSCEEVATACTICCKALGNRAILKPCEHVFDYECIERWLEQRSQWPGRCPMCRVVVESIHHDFDGNGGFTVRLIPLLEPLLGGSFDNDDFPTVSEDPAREAHIALERSRLLARTPESIGGERVRYVLLCTEEDGYHITIERFITLAIEQRDLTTKSTLVREVKILYRGPEDWIPPTPPAQVFDMGTEALLELEKTKREVEGMMNRWLNPSLDEVEESVFYLRPVDINRGHRGIHSRLSGKITIWSTTQHPKSVKIVWETKIEEEGPANRTDEPATQPAIARTRSREWKEEIIKDAVAELSNTLEWFQRRDMRLNPALYAGDALRVRSPAWRRIDAATTNMLEGFPDPRCKYCRGAHSNGYCLLRWVYR